jgi:hypothetical protein
MAPSTDSVLARLKSDRLYCCAAPSTIALERAKINATFANSERFACRRRNLRHSRESGVGKKDRRQEIPAAEAGQGPAAMSDWPLLNLILNLEGFDFAAFLLSAVVAVVAVGFAVDYALGRQGMGPYWNSFYATLGAYAGLCAHDWWLRPYGAYEPYLMISVVVGGLLATVLAVSAIALR